MNKDEEIMERMKNNPQQMQVVESFTKALDSFMEDKKIENTPQNIKMMMEGFNFAVMAVIDLKGLPIDKLLDQMMSLGGIMIFINHERQKEI